MEEIKFLEDTKEGKPLKSIIDRYKVREQKCLVKVINKIFNNCEIKDETITDVINHSDLKSLLYLAKNTVNSDVAILLSEYSLSQDIKLRIVSMLMRNKNICRNFALFILQHANLSYDELVRVHEFVNLKD